MYFLTTNTECVFFFSLSFHTKKEKNLVEFSLVVTLFLLSVVSLKVNRAVASTAEAAAATTAHQAGFPKAQTGTTRLARLGV